MPAFDLKIENVPFRLEVSIVATTHCFWREVFQNRNKGSLRLRGIAFVPWHHMRVGVPSGPIVAPPEQPSTCPPSCDGGTAPHVAQHVANHRLLSSRPDKYVIDTPSTVTLGTSQSELRCFFKGHLLSYSPIVFLAENGSY